MPVPIIDHSQCAVKPTKNGNRPSHLYHATNKSPLRFSCISGAVSHLTPPSSSSVIAPGVTTLSLPPPPISCSNPAPHAIKTDPIANTPMSSGKSSQMPWLLLDLNFATSSAESAVVCLRTVDSGRPERRSASLFRPALIIPSAWPEISYRMQHQGCLRS